MAAPKISLTSFLAPEEAEAVGLVALGACGAALSSSLVDCCVNRRRLPISGNGRLGKLWTVVLFSTEDTSRVKPVRSGP